MSDQTPMSAQPEPASPNPAGPAQPPAYPSYAAPPPPMTPSEERGWAMASHVIPAICTVFSAGFLGFVGALVVYLVYKDRGPFVRASAANSLNIELTVLVVALVSLPLMFLLIGFITLPAAVIGGVVLHVIGALRANEGQWWKPPVTITFVR